MKQGQKCNTKERCEAEKQSTEKNDSLSYENILVNRRKTVMLNLGIKQDFLTDIISINESRTNEISTN